MASTTSFAKPLLTVEEEREAWVRSLQEDSLFPAEIHFDPEYWNPEDVIAKADDITLAVQKSAEHDTARSRIVDDLWSSPTTGAFHPPLPYLTFKEIHPNVFERTTDIVEQWYRFAKEMVEKHDPDPEDDGSHPVYFAQGFYVRAPQSSRAESEESDLPEFQFEGDEAASAVEDNISDHTAVIENSEKANSTEASDKKQAEAHEDHAEKESEKNMIQIKESAAPQATSRNRLPERMTSPPEAGMAYPEAHSSEKMPPPPRPVAWSSCQPNPKIPTLPVVLTQKKQILEERTSDSIQQPLSCIPGVRQRSLSTDSNSTTVQETIAARRNQRKRSIDTDSETGGEPAPKRPRALSQGRSHIDYLSRMGVQTSSRPTSHLTPQSRYSNIQFAYAVAEQSGKRKLETENEDIEGRAAKSSRVASYSQQQGMIPGNLPARHLNSNASVQAATTTWQAQSSPRPRIGQFVSTRPRSASQSSVPAKTKAEPTRTSKLYTSSMRNFLMKNCQSHGWNEQQLKQLALQQDFKDHYQYSRAELQRARDACAAYIRLIPGRRNSNDVNVRQYVLQLEHEYFSKAREHFAEAFSTESMALDNFQDPLECQLAQMMHIEQQRIDPASQGMDRAYEIRKCMQLAIHRQKLALRQWRKRWTGLIQGHNMNVSPPNVTRQPAVAPVYHPATPSPHCRPQSPRENHSGNSNWRLSSFQPCQAPPPAAHHGYQGYQGYYGAALSRIQPGPLPPQTPQPLEGVVKTQHNPNHPLANIRQQMPSNNTSEYPTESGAGNGNARMSQEQGIQFASEVKSWLDIL